MKMMNGGILSRRLLYDLLDAVWLERYGDSRFSPAMKAPMTEEKEVFRCAATQYRGKTYIGSIHPLIYDEIKAANPDASLSDMVEGFVTSTGRFLGREEAKLLANELDLMRRGRDKNMDTKLWSEYLVHGALEQPAFAEMS